MYCIVSFHSPGPQPSYMFSSPTWSYIVLGTGRHTPTVKRALTTTTPHPQTHCPLHVLHVPGGWHCFRVPPPTRDATPRRAPPSIHPVDKTVTVQQQRLENHAL